MTPDLSTILTGLGLLVALVIGVVFGRRPRRPPPPPDTDLEAARLEEATRRRDDALAPVREVTEDPTAERRTEALVRGIDR